MSRDVRQSRSPMSGFVEIDDSDEGPFGVLDVRDEETFSMDTVRVQYAEAATEDVTLNIYDDDYNTDEVSRSDAIDAFLLTPGGMIELDGVTYDDVYDGVVADVGDSRDGDVVVTVGGMKVTG